MIGTQGHYGIITDMGVIGSETELDQLRAMNFEQRLEWHKRNTQFKPSLNLYVTRVDGVLAAMGREEEFEDMFARFLKVLERLLKGKKMPMVNGLTVIELEDGEEIQIRPDCDNMIEIGDMLLTPADARDVAAAIVVACDAVDRTAMAANPGMG